MVFQSIEFQVAGRLGTAQRDRSSFQFDGSFMVGNGPGQDFHQRAFARPIAADQTMNFPRLQIEIDPLQRDRPPKSLANARAAQQRG
jgi:hypothetical protein